MPQAKVLSARIPPEQAGRRLDQALAALFPDITRSQLQQWIEEGRVSLADRLPRKRDKVSGGEMVEIRPPPPRETTSAAQPIPLAIVYEDDDVLVLDKPAGLVVHPGAGNPKDTLLNALLHHFPAAAQLPRAGIVHRLDKDTSGLLVVAKNERARQRLIRQLQKRTVEREYVAIVNGVLVAGGTVEAPIGRHRHERTRMAVTERGKTAITHYRVLKKYRAHTLVQLKLESGRTHQIRVHMAHLHFPLLGDPVYGGRLRVPKGATPQLTGALRGFRRQALHAAKLALVHPTTGERMQWTASVPKDMSGLMEILARDARAHGPP
ncbi:ribosomal large subunit pseudouridine synthase D [Sulfurifustis variabilis]|uniref:Pseudouridine synthase n=1 Tax=Sulfurifustis variabilis TaxID=1675686 RepID=A0A1B4V5S6_9GAMM|nr:23S rRNA pseudouridine(1911/1915/1917) synthase RluD [Sulfurifustis variabilis]BAU48785.1 ribosomal large subunit pseudouridine synthase D [Sulfurifustis variabilis]